MKDLWVLVDVLENDIKSLADFVLNNQRNQSLERSYIRCVFSTLEGMLYVFRQEIIKGSKFDQLFTAREKASLLEKEYDKKSGTVKNKEKYLPLKDSIKTTLKYFARHRGFNSYSFPANSGWESMRKAIEIRHRITHPKSIMDYDISVNDLETVMLSKKWFKEDVMGQFI